MQSQLSSFDKFYRTKHTARKLAWYHSMGTIDIEGRFNPEKKLLTLSLYQGVILLLFNEEDELSYDTIKAHVGLGMPFFSSKLVIDTSCLTQTIKT